MMRNAPSFIGEFPSKHQSKRSFSPPPSELPIEKEASLREKKKKILQRLKKNVDPADGIEVASRPKSLQEVPEKVIFSPRTSKKFLQATQQLHAVSTSSQEIKRLDRAKNPLIVLQKAEKEAVANEEDTKQHPQGNNRRKLSRKVDLSRELRNDDDGADRLSPYVPSFTEKPKRHLIESVSREQKQDRASEHLNPTRKESKVLNHENKKESSKKSLTLPLIITEKEITQSDQNLFSNDANNNLDSYTGSSFRRSASFHSLNDRHQEQIRQIRTSAEKRRQFLKVDDYNLAKASSLSSLYDNPASSTIGGSDGKLYSSSTDFAKQQQQKLEDDFLRVEEDLNRAFSELRKCLRTS